MRKILFIGILYFLISSISYRCNAQQFVDTVYNKNIYTVQLYKQGWELSYPVIRLNSDEKLWLSFDELGTEYKDYWYTLIHCNSNWEPTNISYTEYLNGFEHNQIGDRVFSTTTLVNYVHYSLALPNTDCQPLLSGNYILKIFENNDTSKVQIIKKLYIVEGGAFIDLNVERPEVPKYMMKYQQLRVKVDVTINDYSDLRTEIKTVAVQNFNFCTARKLYLSHLSNNSLFYDDLDSNVFEGGNEFRNFDIKSIKYKSSRIQSLTYNNINYDIVLTPDLWRNKTQYYSDNDINGHYFVANSKGVNKDRDADYQTVYFSLPTPDPILDGYIYVLGELTNWLCNKASKMNYNFQTKAYELKLFLKQGYYNYQFAYKPTDSNSIDLSYLEGRHYETENDYYIFVYYKPVTSRYEQLIGYVMGNSIKKK